MAKHRKRKLTTQREQHAQAKMPPVVGFNAYIYVLLPDEGGRTRPILDGYRVQCRFTAEQPWDNDVHLCLKGQEACAPGEECTAQLEFLVPDAVTVTVANDATFVLREGSRIVVRGTVLEVAYSSDAL